MIIFSVGCNDEDHDADKKINISQNTDSKYEKTFENLSLGRLFDFNFKLPNPDESWIEIWVEGYKEGEPVEPFPLAKLSYGLGPSEEAEGNLGAGFLELDSDNPQIFIYSKGAQSKPVDIDNDLFSDINAKSWDYAIDDEEVGLNFGEEKVLAVYRLGKDSMRASYDYQDSDELDKMIKEDAVVFVMKIVVEEREDL
ncbi:hypothetical protein [Natranaerobius thermophilus]|uniref:Uncharacterized protein n=1 Tax=Natranaerobius thermophilus (strain ATCC BAA-1301 / DSM 18059 / JW/NM-WN-LF) TaxID=457570 RepID=B2A4T7_NATTJ|nr:hypothetical protein [Natranaerobius thermophilus]ACB83859.1 conserved hypothetical protein [Natranaerobius thermophilus JW/NM-WN-LF]